MSKVHIPARAQSRAKTELVRLHKDEYRALYLVWLQKLKAEANEATK